MDKILIDNMTDQYFTSNELVKKCWESFILKMDELGINISNYTFIEPSAGNGAFLSVLPPKTIAIDIEPLKKNIIKQDYLKWKNDYKKKYIVFGNPPFGMRGKLALEFINHSKFADFVCFILPKSFNSDGKGNCKNRVKHLNLIHSNTIDDYFITPENKRIKINGLFQIWAKNYTNPNYKIKKVKTDKMKIYSLSNGRTSSSKRNVKMIDKCDIYLPSTCYGSKKMKSFNTFDELPNKRGYGIIFNKNKKEMIEKAKSINWNKVCFLATNSSLNLRMSLIIEALIN